MLLLISPPVLVLGSCCCLLVLCRCLLGTLKDQSARKLRPWRLWPPLHLSMLGDKVQLWMQALCSLQSNHPFCRGYGIALFSGNSNDRAYSCNSWFMLASTMLEQLVSWVTGVVTQRLQPQLGGQISQPAQSSNPQKNLFVAFFCSSRTCLEL